MVRVITYPVSDGISYPMDMVLFWLFLLQEKKTDVGVGYLGILLAFPSIAVGTFTAGERKHIQEYCQ